jgi:hypothetical protein
VGARQTDGRKELASSRVGIREAYRSNGQAKVKVKMNLEMTREKRRTGGYDDGGSLALAAGAKHRRRAGEEMAKREEIVQGELLLDEADKTGGRAVGSKE